MFADKSKENEWGLGEIPQVLDSLLGDDTDFISKNDLNRIADDFKVLFFGKYNCELKNGRIKFPFKGIKVWAVAEIAEDEICRNSGERYILIANKYSRFESEEITVLTSGECAFDGGLWKIPDVILELLDSESLICEGCGMYAEMMTEKSMARKEAKIMEYCKSLN